MRRADPDMATVEALCVLQLVARRLGCTIRVCEASARLRELITLAGLEDVLLDPASEQPEPEAEEARRWDDAR